MSIVLTVFNAFLIVIMLCIAVLAILGTCALVACGLEDLEWWKKPPKEGEANEN